MKQLKTILLTIFGLLIMTGCKNQQEKSKIKEISKKENITQVKQSIIFEKTLKLQGITFHVKAISNDSSQELTIKAEGLEMKNQNVVHKVEGEVVNAEIEDLNSDGFPEVLVYTKSAGSGSYGGVIGYSVNNGKSMSQIYFPDLFDNKEASKGYMGHDKFVIVETTLVRKFPIYREKDSNSNPTGGTRQVQYKLKDGEASRKFVVDQIVEF